MTERAPRTTRWSRARVRALAWTTGIATFLAGAGVLGAAPMPERPARASGDRRASGPRLVVRRITRRVVIVTPSASAPVTFVAAPTGASTGSSGSAPAPMPAAPQTGGS
jgi:hypothetical protein